MKHLNWQISIKEKRVNERVQFLILYEYLLFLEIFGFLSVYCTNRSDSEDYPINIYSDRYNILQKGIYRIKSIDSTLIASAKVQYVANIFNNTTSLNKQNVMYLANEKPIELCSQSIGYDLGYPDYYVIVVLEDGKDGWKQVYRSQQLDLNNVGEDEFGLSQIYPVEVSNKDNNVVIDFSDYFRITWIGKSVIVDILKKH